MNFQRITVAVSLALLLLGGLIVSTDWLRQPLTFANFGFSAAIVSLVLAPVLLLAGVVIRLAGLPWDDGGDALQQARAFYLAGGLVLLVGASVCFGGLGLE